MKPRKSIVSNISIPSRAKQIQQGGGHRCLSSLPNDPRQYYFVNGKQERKGVRIYVSSNILANYKIHTHKRWHGGITLIPSYRQ